MPESSLIGVVDMEKFEPVMINKGRKFRGFAYWIGNTEHTTSYQLPGWSGRDGWVTSVSVKLWSPTKGFVYANPNYIEDVTDKSEEEVKADYAKYVDLTIKSTQAQWLREGGSDLRQECHPQASPRYACHF